jgi:hypothetical protein
LSACALVASAAVSAAAAEIGINFVPMVSPVVGLTAASVLPAD